LFMTGRTARTSCYPQGRVKEFALSLRGRSGPKITAQPFCASPRSFVETPGLLAESRENCDPSLAGSDHEQSNF
jgi:hypothetical protein